MLELEPLCSCELQIGEIFDLGSAPAGRLIIGEIPSGRFSGDRLSAEVVGRMGADWSVVRRTERSSWIDVRLLLRTDDQALIMIAYQGTLVPLMNETTPLSDVNLYVAATFNTEDERYRWLTELQAVGKGVVIAGDDGAPVAVKYEFYALK